MASTNENGKLQEQLREAGNRLLQPPASVDELLSLLDQVESCLSRVEQSPSKPMQQALSPSLRALVANGLIKHPDVDVRVSVASCISEITRITAPEAPYDDDQMKEVFELIVSSFEKLSDNSSRSYNKRTSILETVAKVRSCVVMLDLECDALILEMFQHFFKAIRENHPENVFSSMETIMTLVLEESEDISQELLSPILASVKKNNEEVLPIARKLGEKVIGNSATKLRPSLIQAVKSLDISLNDYSKVVANICKEASGIVEVDDLNASGEHLDDEGRVAGRVSPDEAAQVSKEITIEEAGSIGEIHPAADNAQGSVLTNGVTETPGDVALVESSSKNPENGDEVNQSKSNDMSSKAEPDSPDTGNGVDSKVKPEQTSKRRGKKPSSSIDAAEPSSVTLVDPPSVSATEPSDSSPLDGEKEPDKLPDSEKDPNKEAGSSSREEVSVEAALPLDNEMGTDMHGSTLGSDAVNVASPSPAGSLPDENRPKKIGKRKKKDIVVQEATLSTDIASKKLSEGTSNTEEKVHKRSGKKVSAGNSNEDTTTPRVDASNEEAGTTSDLETKSLRKVGKKVDTSQENEHELLKKQKQQKRSATKDAKNTAAKDVDKETVSLSKSASKSAKHEAHVEETLEMNSKRKRNTAKEKLSDSKEYGENLVGVKVKVWWPKDQMFYDGIIDSFDPIKKKHRVSYTDGDQEILNLKKERWEKVEGDSVSDGEQGTDHPLPDVSSEMHQKKKAKTNPDLSTKQEKMDASPKRGGGASSSKSRSASSKSGQKSKDDGKSDRKSKVDSSKTTGKLEVRSGGKSKDHTPKSDSKAIDAHKASSKTKNIELDLLKSNKKSEQDTPKTAAKVKGKSFKSGGSSDANGTGKMKSGSSKVKDSEDVQEKSPDQSKGSQISKRKSPDSSKAQGSATKSGKKRRRGAKSR